MPHSLPWTPDQQRLTLAEIEAKFFANAELAVPAAQASQLRDAVFGLDRAADLAPLCAALART